MSSAHNMFISNKEAIPVIKTDIFEESDGMPLAITRVSTEDMLRGDNPIALGYAQLRANVYIDQTRMISESYRRADGGEDDADDLRSLHYVGLEDRGNGEAAVIASMRLIHQTDETPLPINELFEDELRGKNVGPGAFEVSRYIAKSEIRRNSIMSKAAITGVGLSHAIENGWGPCLAVVESPIEADLARMGVPVERIADPKFIEEYNDTNVGIEIDLPEFANRIGHEALKTMYIEEGGVYFFGKR